VGRFGGIDRLEFVDPGFGDQQEAAGRECIGGVVDVGPDCAFGDQEELVVVEPKGLGGLEGRSVQSFYEERVFRHGVKVRDFPVSGMLPQLGKSYLPEVR